MIDNLVSMENINLMMVFIQGLLSFFSPCIIPLIPVYMGYLAGNTNEVNEDGSIKYNRIKVMIHTLFFVLGISFSFFILGMAFSSLGKFFNTNKMLFTRIGGIIIIILGLFQLGIFEFKFLQRERKFNLNLSKKEANPIIAFLMGFTFSFAWTPCVGAYLSSVLLMAASAKTKVIGNMLIIIYASGFLIPFLLLGLFTAQVLSFLKKRKNFVKYSIKIGGVILVIMGVMTFTGWMNSFSTYLNSFTGAGNNITDVVDGELDGDMNNTPDTEDIIIDDTSKEENIEEESIDDEIEEGSKDVESELLPIIDFTLIDQYGNTHTLSDYKGKVVFLNFWATWCPPCKKEMPDIEEIYKEYGLNEDEVVVLGVANPKSKEYPNNSDEDKEYITSFLEKNAYTFPTVFDETGETYGSYFISSFPTTFIITKEGEVLGYIPGMMTKDMMISVIKQALDYN